MATKLLDCARRILTPEQVGMVSAYLDDPTPERWAPIAHLPISGTSTLIAALAAADPAYKWSGDVRSPGFVLPPALAVVRALRYGEMLERQPPVEPTPPGAGVALRKAG